MKRDAFFSAIDKVIGGFIRIQAIIAGIFMLFMISTIVHGVFMRYVLRSPQAYSFELAKFSLMPLTVFTLAYTQRLRGHVRVEVLVMHLPATVRRVFETISDILFLVYAAGLLYAGWVLTLTFITERMTSEDARFPLWIVAAVMVLGLIGTCAQLVVDIGKPRAESGGNVSRTENGHEVISSPERKE